MDRFDYSRPRRRMPDWLLPLIALTLIVVAWHAMGGEGPEIRKPTAIQTEQ